MAHTGVDLKQIRELTSQVQTLHAELVLMKPSDITDDTKQQMQSLLVSIASLQNCLALLTQRP